MMRWIRTFIIGVATLCSSIGIAQTFTPITATITAESFSNSAYYNGSWSAKYYNPSSTLPPVYTKTGVKVQTIYSGVMDGTGTFTQSMPDTSAISPAGGSWIFTVCPDGTANCTTMKSVPLTGTSTIDLSATFSDQIPVTDIITPVFQVGYGYNYGSMLNYNSGVSPYYVNGSMFVTVPNSAGITPYHIFFHDFDGWHDLSSGSTPTVPTCIDLASDYVCTDPTTSQTITQPVNTVFGVTGAGGSYFGNPSNSDMVINGGNYNNSSGARDEFYGFQAGSLAASTSDEVGIGFQALENDASGQENIGIGSYTLGSDISSFDDVAIGYDAMGSYTGNNGNGNVAIGGLSLSAYYGGDSIGGNIAIGYSALSLETGYGNLGIGTYAGYNDESNYQFYVNNVDNPNSNQADDRLYSLIWGTFANVHNSYAGSQLTFNSEYLHFPHITSTPCSTGYALYQDTSAGLNDGVKTDSSGCAITTITSTDSSVTITPSGDTADLKVNFPTVDSSQWGTESGCAFSSDGNGLFCNAGVITFSPGFSNTSYHVQCTANYSDAMLTTTSAMPSLFVGYIIDNTTQITVYESLNNGSSVGYGIATNYGVTITCQAHD